MITQDGFRVEHDGNVVTVTKNVTHSEFADAVGRANQILGCFARSSPGSVWGCDGVGYVIQQRAGLVRVCKSGIGPRKFKQGLGKLI